MHALNKTHGALRAKLKGILSLSQNLVFHRAKKATARRNGSQCLQMRMHYCLIGALLDELTSRSMVYTFCRVLHALEQRMSLNGLICFLPATSYKAYGALC